MTIKILISLLMKAGMTSPYYSDDCQAVCVGGKAVMLISIFSQEQLHRQRPL